MRAKRAAKVCKGTPESEDDLPMSADQVPSGVLVLGRKDRLYYIVNETRDFILLMPGTCFVVTGGTVCYLNDHVLPFPHPDFANWKHRMPPGTAFVRRDNRLYTIEARDTTSVHAPYIHGGVHIDVRGAQGTGHVNIGTVHGDVHIDHIGVGGAAEVFEGVNMSVQGPSATAAVPDIQEYHAKGSLFPGPAQQFDQRALARTPVFNPAVTAGQGRPTEEITPSFSLSHQVEPKATEGGQTTLGNDSSLHIGMQGAWGPDCRPSYTQGNAVSEVTSEPNSTANTSYTVNSNFPVGTNQIPNWTETLSDELVEALSREFGHHSQTSA